MKNSWKQLVAWQYVNDICHCTSTKMFKSCQTILQYMKILTKRPLYHTGPSLPYWGLGPRDRDHQVGKVFVVLKKKGNIE